MIPHCSSLCVMLKSRRAIVKEHECTRSFSNGQNGPVEAICISFQEIHVNTKHTLDTLFTNLFFP